MKKPSLKEIKKMANDLKALHNCPHCMQLKKEIEEHSARGHPQ